MKPLNDNDLLSTPYAKLLIGYASALLSDPQIHVDNVLPAAKKAADATLEVLVARRREEEERQQQLIELARAQKLARGKIPITWEPEEDDGGNRSGRKWTDAERQALGDRLRNGDSINQMVLAHRRTANAIAMQLEAQGLVDRDDDGRFIDRETGEVLL